MFYGMLLKRESSKIFQASITLQGIHYRGGSECCVEKDQRTAIREGGELSIEPE
jgi:hypothetical protein